jgi:hypothetical protein
MREGRLAMPTYVHPWKIIEVDDWVITKTEGCTEPNPGSTLQLKQPLYEFSRMAILLGDDNPRFKLDNKFKLDLDLPERYTEDL